LAAGIFPIVQSLEDRMNSPSKFEQRLTLNEIRMNLIISDYVGNVKNFSGKVKRDFKR